MKKVCRSFLAFLTVCCLVCGLFSVCTLTVSAATGTSFANSIVLSNNQKQIYRWQAANFPNDYCYNAISVPSRGYVTLYTKIPSSSGNWYDYVLYDSAQNEVWSCGTYLEQDYYTDGYCANKVGLEAGTYYWKIVPSFQNYIFSGSSYYSMEYWYSFTQSKDWEIEKNNSMIDATPISLNQTMNGVFNDEASDISTDYYRISMNAGTQYRITLVYEDFHRFNLLNSNGEYLEMNEYNGVVNGKTQYWVFQPNATDTYYFEFYNCVGQDREYQLSVINETEARLRSIISSVGAADGGIRVQWSAEAAAKKFAVYRKTQNSGWTQIGTTTAKSYTDTTVQSGVKYSYAVKGSDGTYWGALSNASVFVEYIAVPTSISVTRIASGNTVKWNRVQGTSGYVVYRRTNGAGQWSKLATLNSSTNVYTDTTAIATNAYEYKLQTYKGSFTSSLSSAVGVYLPAPVLSKVVNASNGVSVSWKAVALVNGYTIYRRTGNGSFSKLVTVSGSALNYVDKTAKPKIAYQYAVKANCGSYASAYSVAKSITRLAKTSGVKVTSVSNGLKVGWNKTSGVSGYQVYRKASGGAWKKIATVKGTGYTDKTVKTGVNYYYKVRSYKGSSVSAFSSAVKPSVQLKPSSVALLIGQTKTLKKSGVSGTVKFSSNKKSVATVTAQGKIIAKKAGKATITMKGKGFKKTVTVVVKRPTISISGASGVESGRYVSLKASVYPAGCKVKWSSSNTKVATVNSNGRVTGKKAGKTTITATITYKGKSYKATKRFTVTRQTPSWELNATKYGRLIEVTFTNYGTKPLRIYSGGSYWYNGYSTTYLNLAEDKHVSYEYCDYLDIKPKSTQYLIFDSYLDLYNYAGSYLYFDYRYDGANYYAVTSF